MTVRPLALVFALVFVLGGCNSGNKEGASGTFEVGTPKSTATPAQGSTVAPGKLKTPSPARMFAGTQSVTGQLTRYCKSSCVVATATDLAYLKAPTGAFVLFTIAELPVTAVAEVRATPSEKPANVTLNPSTVMVFNHGLGQGTYLVDLFVRWRSSEARWRFGLKIT